MYAAVIKSRNFITLFKTILLHQTNIKRIVYGFVVFEMWPMFPPIFTGICAQKFQVLQIFSPHLQKPAHTKLSVCEIINVELVFLNTAILIGINILFACFNKTGDKQDNKKINRKLLYCFILM
jgi:hypothetical protein